MAPEGRVAVVVATRNRASALQRTLRRLVALPEQPAVIVVDNASDDGTGELIRASFPDVRVIELSENAGAAARTVGARHTETPFVAFSDDDSWWAPGALARAADVLEGCPRLALLAARILVGPDEREDETCAAMANSPLGSDADLPGRRVLGFVACGSVVRRSAFLGVGGFDARFAVGGEERVLAVDLERAGWRLAYVPEVVAHHHPSTERDEWGRREAELRNALWFAWLRRPLPAALRVTLGVARDAVRDPAGRSALAGALSCLAWVARERRPVSGRLELDLRALG